MGDTAGSMNELKCNVVQPKIAGAKSWKHKARRVHREAQVFYFALKHPRVPWYAKLVAACTAGYLFSPVQLIPSFIPVIGFLDDFLVLFLGIKLVQRIIPPDVLMECRELAKAAEMRRKDEIKSPATVVAIVAVVTVWFIASIAASRLIAFYIARR
jgi:uncharacterized membrane protein YkvA (DUF1232 family)